MKILYEDDDGDNDPKRLPPKCIKCGLNPYYYDKTKLCAWCKLK